MSIQKFFTHTIEIKGKVTKTTLSTCKGLINALSGNDVYQSAKRNIIADYALYVPANTVISESNIVYCEGITYDVVLVTNPMQANMFLKVYLRVVK